MTVRSNPPVPNSAASAGRRRVPRLALAAILSAGAPGFEARAQESTTLDEISVAGEGSGRAAGNAPPSGRTTVPGAIGLIGPTPGYRADRAVSSTKTDTPQRDVPQIVTVAPREVITDLAATRVDRVFNYTPGVAQQNNFGGLSIFSYAIRGTTTSEIYKNGFPLNRGTPPPPDAQNVERIEVLKGPGGGLFGRSDPGGLVNIITKQPTAERFVEMGGLWGSFEQFRGTVDSGGALNEDGTLLYRFNLAAGRQNSFRDFVDSDRLLVAPVISWQVTPDTRITVETEFLRNRIVFDRGVIAVNGRLGVIPISRFLGEPGQSTYQTNNSMQVRVDHRFDADWQMRLATYFNTGTLRVSPPKSVQLPPTIAPSRATATCATTAGTWRSGRRKSSVASTRRASAIPCCSASSARAPTAGRSTTARPSRRILLPSTSTIHATASRSRDQSLS